MTKEEFKKIVEQLSLEDLIKLKDFAECLRDSEPNGEAYPVSQKPAY